MSDAPRPMTPADYLAGYPLPTLHPTRDLVVGAVIGAAALWAVPKLLDYLVGGWLGVGDPDNVELEVEG